MVAMILIFAASAWGVYILHRSYLLKTNCDDSSQLESHAVIWSLSSRMVSIYVCCDFKYLKPRCLSWRNIGCTDHLRFLRSWYLKARPSHQSDVDMRLKKASYDDSS